MPRNDYAVTDTSHLSVVQLAEATNATFAEYLVPISHTPAGFAGFCRSFDLDVAESVLLTHRDGRLIGLAMLGLRGDRGWCGGLGIVPAFRGQGLAGVLTGALIARARRLGLRTLQLEVLVRNERAFKAYRRAGFRVTRDLLILSAATQDVLPAVRAQRSGPFDVRPVVLDQVWRILGRMEPLSSRAPAWQREIGSLLTVAGAQALAAWQGETPQALLVGLAAPGGQISIGHLAFTREDAACTLLAQVGEGRAGWSADKPAHFLILNEPADTPLCALLLRLGLREAHRQHEMLLELR